MKTSGGANQCGIRALWKSFRDAREAMKQPGEEIKHATQKQFVNWMKSDRYKAKVEELMHNPAYAYLTDKDGNVDKEARNEIRAGSLQTDNLSSEQILLLSQVANEELGTNFVVGFIIQGWRCKFNKTTRTWNLDFVKETSFQLDAGQPIASLKAGDKPNPAPPIIWVWNDDASNREHVSNISKESYNSTEH